FSQETKIGIWLSLLGGLVIAAPFKDLGRQGFIEGVATLIIISAGLMAIKRWGAAKAIPISLVAGAALTFGWLPAELLIVAGSSVLVALMLKSRAEGKSRIHAMIFAG